MSSLRRSPAIPLSPSSPPESGLKQRKRRLSEDFHTYPSTPPLMPVATKTYIPASHDNSHALNHITSPATQTSTYGSQTQRSNASVATSTTSIPGLGLDSEEDVSDQHRDKRRKTDNVSLENAASEKISQPTNHERQGGSDVNQNVQVETAPIEESKPEEPIEQDGSDESQQQEAEPLFLRESPLAQTSLDPRKHLLAHFDLIPLLKTVARVDPTTGEKIAANKLRKSYEGQIKGFQLAGRNKSVKSEELENRKRPLRSLIEDISEEEWTRRHPDPVITPPADFRAALMSAMRLRSGELKDNAKWENIIGHDPKPTATIQPPPPNTQQVTPTSTAPQTNGIARPKIRTDGIRARRGKKRSYTDDSFAGYEGYQDEESDEAQAQSDSDDDGGGSSVGRNKKRRF